jgi:hypothetical protein
MTCRRVWSSGTTTATPKTDDRRRGEPGELVVRITPTKVLKAFDLTN